ncbi:MAG: alpha-L-rhamnosidase N-terminal domain-containing protein [Cytophagales bacterium]|nr:alpha-L-rhamnosidase N-terminal domain-containing protein [Bernardetiaceae bacterium]MDW8211378.1 alpha-L-rhamnosidase N-terminal domain-containing protein [Cytophagales bacterium]
MRIALTFWLFLPLILAGQNVDIHPRILNREWEAYWIACPNTSLRAFGVYHFRKRFLLESQPRKFIVHVSADNRYRLFVNGTPVAQGPARGDLFHWYFESIDIAPYLQKGTNVVAAVVWNFAEYAPWAQMSFQTGFIMQGNTTAESVVNTDTSWKVMHNPAITPIVNAKFANDPTIAVGPGESLEAANYPWHWQTIHYDDSHWLPALPLYKGMPRNKGTSSAYYLMPRPIPLWQEHSERFAQVRYFSGISNVPQAWLQGKQVLTIPAYSRVSILIDNQVLTTAYPELTVQGGKNALVEITYVESLVDHNLQKHHRNRIEGLEIIGYKDRLLPDGGPKRLFRPLWWRTFRYVQLDIQTESDPLGLIDFSYQFTAYPLEEKAQFNSDDPELKKIWQVSWRTARLCAHETYINSPYYEQVQSVAEARILALVSLYVSGDDRLMRKAILDFNYSRLPEGLTQSRYPSRIPQIIPPFSLYWIGMVYDYWQHRRDDDFIRQMLPGIEEVLQWFADNVDRSENMLGPLPWWNFVDWTQQWQYINETNIGGVPEGVEKGYSSILTFQYAYALRQAAELFEYYQRKEQAALYLQQAELLAKSAYNACYDIKRGLVADTPEKNSFSQHAQIMAVLSGGAPLLQQASLIERALADPTVTPVSIYYHFYLTRAMVKAGIADFYYASLQPWREMLAKGLTTFAQKEDPTRSDCYGWSASPNYEFLATICGITPEGAGFEKVRIAPALGLLNRVEAVMPHPEGTIRLWLQRLPRNAIKAVIFLPSSLEGTFVWNGKNYLLSGGLNQLTAK